MVTIMKRFPFYMLNPASMTIFVPVTLLLFTKHKTCSATSCLTVSDVYVDDRDILRRKSYFYSSDPLQLRPILHVLLSLDWEAETPLLVIGSDSQSTLARSILDKNTHSQ